MSILGFLFKSKTNLSKKNTKYVKLGKYELTSHAQNRIVDPARKTKKWDVLNNLFTKPHAITKTKLDHYGRPSYNRIGKTITTSINPKNNYVVSLRPVSDAEEKKYDLTRKGRKYVKKSKYKNSRTHKRKNH